MANLIIGAVITGILTGGVYALMSSGLTLIFGVMEIINIAQGALVILGAYLSYWLQANYHIDILVGLLITMPTALTDWIAPRSVKLSAWIGSTFTFRQLARHCGPVERHRDCSFL